MTQLHDARLVAVRSIVAERVRELAEVAGGANFEEFFDATMRALLVESFRAIGAHDEHYLIIRELPLALGEIGLQVERCIEPGMSHIGRSPDHPLH